MQLGIQNLLPNVFKLYFYTLHFTPFFFQATLLHNAVDNVENKIFEVLDLIGDKMAPVIQKFLVEGCSLVAYAGRKIDSLVVEKLYLIR